MSLSDLNTVQREAALATDGPVMILAGAGSGKTKTLTMRLSYLLEELHIPYHKILAMTFSNKAAKEMRTRIGHGTSEDIGGLQITTFHSFCARVLRSEVDRIGLSKNFVIYDKTESRAVLKSILQRHGISTKELSPYEILNYIDEIKNKGLYQGRSSGEDEIDRDHEFYGYYLEYEAELHKANATDFGGLIVGAIELFERYPEVLTKYQDRFQYILVDEYQDTNRAQFDLIKMLADKWKNICVVGDEDQSIYSWRGADINNILDFEKHFSHARVFKLEQNYRSSRTIIEAASQVISNNSMRKDKSLWTDNPQGDPINIVECSNESMEAEFITEEIKKRASDISSFNDVAIFYRTNAQSRVIEDNLRSNDIPYRVVGGVKFYDRKEIKDIIGYLRVVINNKDSLSLSRIINTPARGVGVTTLRKIESEAIKQNCSLWDIIQGVVDNSEIYSHLKIGLKIRSSLSEFVTLINEVSLLEHDGGDLPSVLYEKVLHESGYWNSLEVRKDYESVARIENLQELAGAIKQYETSVAEPSLSGFLERIALDVSNNEDDNASNGEISMMTVHGAKGLEFEYVFLVGAEENIFPSYHSLEDIDGDAEEERRLFYVAMTRTMRHLYICFARGRMLFGQLKFNSQSRFIGEIPSDYCTWHKKIDPKFLNGEGAKKVSIYSRQHDEYNQETFTDSDVVYRVDGARSSAPTFPVGTMVKHLLYGRGKVLDSAGGGDDEKVTIKFRGGAKKKFMVKFAPLDRLN